MEIKGRHASMLDSSFSGSIIGSTIRIDDEKNLPFWLEINLTLVEIENLRLCCVLEEPQMLKKITKIPNEN